MRGLPAVVGLQGGGAPPAGFEFLNLVPILLIFLIFYLLLIRPQTRKQRDREKMIKAVQKGDSVVTSGGLHGKVTGTTDQVLTLEIAAVRGDRVRVKVDRAQIDRVVEKAKAVEES